MYINYAGETFLQKMIHRLSASITRHKNCQCCNFLHLKLSNSPQLFSASRHFNLSINYFRTYILSVSVVIMKKCMNFIFAIHHLLIARDVKPSFEFLCILVTCMTGFNQLIKTR